MKKEVQAIIKNFKVFVKKSYGQNFLIDKNYLNKIISQLNTSRFSVVMEIGPGLGVLTKNLVKLFEQVLCYEIDGKMVEVLQKTLISPNLIVLNQDVLLADIEKDIARYLGTRPVLLVANLPYYITTPILIKIIEEVPAITQLLIMVQKEVAERICGDYGTKEYNQLSVLIQYFMETKRLFNVPPPAFYPKPGVDSSVILLTRKEHLEIKATNLAYFLKFNRAIFMMRRKTLANNLVSAFSYPKEQITKIIQEYRHDPNIRAERLSVPEIVDLANAFYSQLNR